MKAIGYCRVSTSEQGQSGLGLEGQQDDIKRFCDANGIELLRCESEVASAKGNYLLRQVLVATIERCKKEGALLIVSKLDRLSRDVESVANLLNDKKVEFVVAQVGLDCDTFQIQLYAALAQKERDYISQRTKTALEAKRKRRAEGLDLNRPVGNQVNAKEASAKGIEVIKMQANERITPTLRGLLIGWTNEGLSMSAIARKLNELNVPTPRGGKWHQSSVSLVLTRIYKLQNGTSTIS